MDFLAVDFDQHDKRQHAAAGAAVALVADLAARGAGRPARIATALVAGWGAGAAKELADRRGHGHDSDARDFLATGYGATVGVVVIEGARYVLTLRTDAEVVAVGAVLRW